MPQCLLRLRLSMLLGMFALLHAVAQAGPIHEAAESGDEALLAQLLAAGTAPDERTLELQVTALHIAARHGHTALMAKLLAAGADPNSVDTQGWTALHEAAGEGHPAAVQLLLAAGTDLTVQNTDFQTALQYAAKCLLLSTEQCCI